MEVVFGGGKAVASSVCCFQAESTVRYGGGQRERLGRLRGLYEYKLFREINKERIFSQCEAKY